MSENRVEKFMKNDKKGNNAFKYVEFERFDQSVTQSVTKKSVGGSEEENEELFEAIEDIITQQVTISRDTQLLKTLNLWIGHCNVNVSEPIKDIIKEIDGVESLDIMTRYRFRVGIGKLFSENLVKTNIAQHIENYIDKK